MSQKFIPEQVDPYRYAEQNLRLDGMVKVSDMARLTNTLPLNDVNNDTMAIVSLTFGRDEQGIVYLQGHVTVDLQLQCQRCLEPYKYGIISDFLVGIVNSLDEANALPEHYEPAMTIEDGRIFALRELIEDELFLNLPIIPRHEPEDCKVQLPVMDAGWDDTKESQKNPFQVLKNLKGKS